MLVTTNQLLIGTSVSSISPPAERASIVDKNAASQNEQTKTADNCTKATKQSSRKTMTMCPAAAKMNVEQWTMYSIVDTPQQIVEHVRGM